MGFSEILTLIFITLKLTGVITWSWFYVLLPEIITYSVIILGITVLGIIWVVCKVIVHLLEKNHGE